MQAAVLIVANAAKGISVMQLARDLDVQNKSAKVLSHKLHVAIESQTGCFKLSGVVEVGGACFGGHIRPANRKEDPCPRARPEAPRRRRDPPPQGPPW